MLEQELDAPVEFTTDDRSCDSCVHMQVMCMWPTTRSLRQVCFRCQRMHGKCKIGGTSMTAWGPCQVGVHKKHKVMSKVVSKAIIEELGDDMTCVLPPAPKVIRKVETPFEKALAGIVDS